MIQHDLTLIERTPFTADHCLKLAQEFGIRNPEARAALDQVNKAVGRWTSLAEDAGCAKKVAREIAGRFKPL